MYVPLDEYDIPTLTPLNPKKKVREQREIIDKGERYTGKWKKLFQYMKEAEKKRKWKMWVERKTKKEKEEIKKKKLCRIKNDKYKGG